jgi:hypothetical protein
MNNPEQTGGQGDASPGLTPPLGQRGDHPPCRCKRICELKKKEIFNRTVFSPGFFKAAIRETEGL